ncbi:hypothetical protein AB0B48_09060 [Micromonospora sp. NPDC049089]|uniref:hypothetical protein n=1 Tax=Micromonospora sp. NPDC049089 TaxID=3155496 RepID=UPI0033C7192C
MTGRWETLTADQQAAVLTNLRGWLDLGHDPLLRSAIAVLDGDPHPDCGHEWHGADGGPCPGCGWDSHPIPDRPTATIVLDGFPDVPPLVVPYQAGRHADTHTNNLPTEVAS